MKWKPDVRSGVWIGVAIAVGILLGNAGLLWRAIRGPVNGLTFVCALFVLLSLPALGTVGYRIYDLSRLRYALDRNQLTISTAGTRQVIPTRNVERVIDGSQVALVVRLRSLVWPGAFVGHGHIEGIGMTLFYAVASPKKQAIVVTPSLAYGISVDDMDAFMEVLATCQEIGPSIEVEQKTERAHFVEWDIWRDRAAQGFLLGSVLLNTVLFGLLLFRYPRLPHLLPLHFDAGGAVDRIAPRQDVFALPFIGLIILVVNGTLGAVLYRRERLVSYIAWSGAVLVQALFLVALWNIVV